MNSALVIHSEGDDPFLIDSLNLPLPRTVRDALAGQSEASLR
jgi:hypothetical protein